MSIKSVRAPKRGEVWRVDLDPVLGSETGKARPAVVISSNRLARLPVHVIVPCTDWKAAFGNYPWMVRLDPTAQNGLQKSSAADGFQVRTVSVDRFLTRWGAVTNDESDDIAQAVAVVIEYRVKNAST